MTERTRICMGQVPAFLGNKEDYMASLIGSIVCLITLCAYCVFQVGAESHGHPPQCLFKRHCSLLSSHCRKQYNESAGDLGPLLLQLRTPADCGLW